MLGDIIYNKELGYLHYTNSSIDSIEDRFMNMDLILSFCNRYNCKKILVDLRGQDAVTDFREEYDFARAFKRKLNDLKIAVIFDSKSVEISFLKEMLENNLQGEICRFDIEETAVEWLITS